MRVNPFQIRKINSTDGYDSHVITVPSKIAQKNIGVYWYVEQTTETIIVLKSGAMPLHG